MAWGRRERPTVTPRGQVADVGSRGHRALGGLEREYPRVPKWGQPFVPETTPVRKAAWSGGTVHRGTFEAGLQSAQGTARRQAETSAIHISRSILPRTTRPQQQGLLPQAVKPPGPPLTMHQLERSTSNVGTGPNTRRDWDWEGAHRKEAMQISGNASAVWQFAPRAEWPVVTWESTQ